MSQQYEMSGGTMREINEAFLRMERNRPNSTAVLKELGALGKKRDISQADFRGWMGDVGGYDEEMMRATGVLPDADNLQPGYWAIWRIGVRGKAILWVSLPSMRSGSSLPGETIQIGSERVRIGQYTREQLDAMVRQGYEQLLALAGKAPEI